MSRTLTAEVSTKLLLTRPWHRVTYTYARESRGSAPPYRVRCSCGADFGWLRCTLPVALALARSHVEPEAEASHAQSSAQATSAPIRPAQPAPAQLRHSLPLRPATAVLAPDAAPLPPCALDAVSRWGSALDWLARGD